MHSCLHSPRKRLAHTQDANKHQPLQFSSRTFHTSSPKNAKKHIVPNPPQEKLKVMTKSESSFASTRWCSETMPAVVVDADSADCCCCFPPDDDRWWRCCRLRGAKSACSSDFGWCSLQVSVVVSLMLLLVSRSLRTISIILFARLLLMLYLALLFRCAGIRTQRWPKVEWHNGIRRQRGPISARERENVS